MFYLRDHKYRHNPSEGRNTAKSQLRLDVTGRRSTSRI